MIAQEVITKLADAGISIKLDGENLGVSAAQRPTDDQLDYLKSHKSQLVAYFQTRESMALSLDDALANICHGLSITVEEVHAALAPEDIADWRDGNLSTETLTAFTESLLQQRDMAIGIVPATYTQKAVCRRCGPVWLWVEGIVDGCPWCFHRAAGRAVPRPTSNEITR